MKRSDLINGVKSGYAFMYASTYEMTRCIEEITEMVKVANEQEYEGELKLMAWDCEDKAKPNEILQRIDEATPYTICLLKNFNWFMYDASSKKQQHAMVQFFQNREQVYTEEETRKIVIIVSHEPFENAIPTAIEKIFLPLDFGLPGKEELSTTLDYIIGSAKESNPKFVEPSSEEREDILSALKSMTVQEATQALSFSLITKKRFDVEVLTAIRDKCIEKIAGIKAVDVSTIDPEKIKGMSRLKKWTLKAMQGAKKHLMKGILLLGPPGVGKTTFFKWLARVLGIRLYMIEVAELFGSLVGESEQKMKALLDILPLLGPGIFVFDEIEKALSGMKGGSKGDSGTTSRSLAQFLKFLSEPRPEGVWIFATCNDISQLPPEWVRPGRWSTSAWFIDLPNEEEKVEILDYYKGVYEVDGKTPNMDGWTGGEIECLCENAALMEEPIHKVVDFICPISKTMKDEIEQLREWAKGRTIDAATIAVSNGVVKKKGKRAINLN